MGTNFYWKVLPRELEKYGRNAEQYVGDCRVLWHIGKRCSAGLYCHHCGTTLNKYGTDHVHDCEAEWYKRCPICGRKGVHVTSFCWTFMKHKWIVEKLYNENCEEKLIVDGDGKEYTPQEFLRATKTPIEFQSCCEFC